MNLKRLREDYSSLRDNHKYIQSKNLKQNEAQSARAESTRKGVNQRSKYVTLVQKQRPESPTVTLTWPECKYKVHKIHPRYILSHLACV